MSFFSGKYADNGGFNRTMYHIYRKSHTKLYVAYLSSVPDLVNSEEYKGANNTPITTVQPRYIYHEILRKSKNTFFYIRNSLDFSL